MKLADLLFMVVVSLLSACSSGVVVPPSPAETAKPDVRPVQESVQQAGASISDARAAIERAKRHAGESQAQTRIVRMQLGQAQDLTKELRETNQAMADRFAKIYRDLMREINILEGKLQKGTEALMRAEMKADDAGKAARASAVLVSDLRDQITKRDAEVVQYRADRKAMVGQIQVAQQAAEKYRKAAGKYRGYYDIFWKVFWIGLVLVILLGLWFYYSPPGFVKSAAARMLPR